MRELIAALGRRTEAYLLAVILVIGVALTVATPAFLTLANAMDLLESWSVTAILAIGAFVVLVAGGIDISFAATASVAQYLAAYAASRLGVPMPGAIAIGLGAGFLLGLVNAVLIHVFKVVSIIITIATMSVYFALLMYVTGARSIYDLPEWWTTKIIFYETESAAGDPIMLTLPIVAMFAVALLTALLMNRTRAGRQLYAMGGNPEAARRLGINIWAMHVLAYGYLGLLAGLAGLLQAHRVQEAVPSAMVGQELNVIAAAVLGGASLMGGAGSVGGVLLGVLLLAMLQNGLNLIGVSPYFFQIVIGLAILVSTSITGLSTKLRARRRRTLAEAPHG